MALLQVIPQAGQRAAGVQLGYRVEAGREVLGGRPVPRLDLADHVVRDGGPGGQVLLGQACPGPVEAQLRAEHARGRPGSVGIVRHLFGILSGRAGPGRRSVGIRADPVSNGSPRATGCETQIRAKGRGTVTTTAAAADTRRHTGTYPAEPRQVGLARAALAGWLGGCPQADEAILIASEVARVRCVSGELLTIASLNTRGIPLTGSQLAARYAVIGAGFDAGDAHVVCFQEVFTYWHLRLLVRRMRSFRQVSYRPAPAGPAARSGHVLPAAGIRHGVPAFRPAAPGSRCSPGVSFPGQAERRPGDPASPPGAVRDQHPSGGQL